MTSSEFPAPRTADNALNYVGYDKETEEILHQEPDGSILRIKAKILPHCDTCVYHLVDPQVASADSKVEPASDD